MAPSEETNINGEAMQLKHVEGDQDGILFAMNMVSTVVYPLAVKTANELGIFDIIAKAGEGAKLSAEEITEKIGVKNPEAPTMVDRILRLLASHSMLSSCLGEDGQNSGKRVYGLTYASKYFVTDADGISFGASLDLVVGKVFLDSWSVFDSIHSHKSCVSSTFFSKLIGFNLHFEDGVISMSYLNMVNIIFIFTHCSS